METIPAQAGKRASSCAPATPGPIPPVDPPCPGCGARRYDRGRFFGIYGLCAWCFFEQDEDNTFPHREAAGDAWRERQPVRERQPDPTECLHPPGSEGKIQRMAFRLAAGYELHHSLDSRPGKLPDRANVGAPVLEDHQSRPDSRSPTERSLYGIHEDSSRNPSWWRVQFNYRGLRMHLGTWPTVDKACQVRDSFFADMRRQQCKREGPWDHSTGSEPPAAAIIGTPEGWRALDVPEDVLPVAAKAAGKKLKGRIWTTVTAAKAALLQEIAKLPKPTRLLGRKAKTAVSFTSRTRKKSTKGHPKGGSQIKQEK